MSAICRSHLCSVVEANAQIQQYDGSIVPVQPLTVACPVTWYTHAVGLCFPTDTTYMLTGPCGDACVDECAEHTYGYVEGNAAFAVLDRRHHAGVEPVRVRVEEAGRYSMISVSETGTMAMLIPVAMIALFLVGFVGLRTWRRLRMRKQRQEVRRVFETTGASPRLPPLESDMGLRDFTL